MKRDIPKFRFYSLTSSMRVQIRKGELLPAKLTWVSAILPIEYWREGCYYFRNYDKINGYIYRDGSWYIWGRKEQPLITYPYVSLQELQFMSKLGEQFLTDYAIDMLEWYKQEMRGKAIRWEMRKRLLRARNNE